MKRALLVVLSFPVIAFGEFAPALAPLAEKHRTEVSALEKERETEVQTPRQVYLAALRQAEQKATADGDKELLASILGEIRLVESGVRNPLPPADFPRKLEVAHRTFTRAAERVDDRIDKERKRVDSEYLKELAKIEAAAGTDGALGEQIQSEKERVLSGITGPISDLRAQLKGTRWQSVRLAGKIHHFRENGYMEHWRYTTPERDTVVIHWNANSRKVLKLAKDGKTLTAGGVPDMVLVRETGE